MKIRTRSERTFFPAEALENCQYNRFYPGVEEKNQLEWWVSENQKKKFPNVGPVSVSVFFRKPFNLKRMVQGPFCLLAKKW